MYFCVRKSFLDGPNCGKSAGQKTNISENYSSIDLMKEIMLIFSYTTPEIVHLWLKKLIDAFIQVDLHEGVVHTWGTCLRHNICVREKVGVHSDGFCVGDGLFEDKYQCYASIDGQFLVRN